MILVTVGTHYLSFDRLIKKIDEIALSIDEEIIAQIGNSKYKPKNIKYFTLIIFLIMSLTILSNGLFAQDKEMKDVAMHRLNEWKKIFTEDQVKKLGFELCGYNDHYFANHDIALFFSKWLR